ncbi:MAG: hypothetical protein GEU28_09430 [Dehalococcoidia bacterium]|nr:hypothetical protein [Dehalococcoidia bacterium]
MEHTELMELIERSALEAGDRELLATAFNTAREGAAEASAQAQVTARRLEDETKAGVARYRELLIAANPDLPADFIQGESYAEIDERLAAIRSAAESVEKRLSAASGVDPAVGLARSAPAYAALTGEAKIAAALASRRR